MSDTLYIILGFFILFIIYFLVTWGLTSLYYFILKQKVSFVKNLKITLSLAFVGFVTGLLLMVVFSTLQIIVFGLTTSLVSLVLYYGALKLLWKVSNYDAISISVALAIVLNPAWLRLLGIL